MKKSKSLSKQVNYIGQVSSNFAVRTCWKTNVVYESITLICRGAHATNQGQAGGFAIAVS